MIKHIVIFKASESTGKLQLINKLKEIMDTLPAQINEIKYYETGLNVGTSKNAFDLVLISEFESINTLEKYRIHPAHQEVIKFIVENKIETRVVDYEF